jgi:MFS family permease
VGETSRAGHSAGMQPPAALVAAADEAASPAAPRGDAATTWPSNAVAWYTVSVLALTVLFAELDRSIISLLVPPIKRDLHLTDTRVGLLLGPAFALFYTFIGIPVARFVDRHSRKSILSVGLAVWSVATVFCGLAQTFAQLLLARMMLGAGEAVNGPATFSMISDSFPKARLPRAIAVMQLGVVAGTSLALLLGAAVVALLAKVPPIALGAFGVVRGWQLVFIAVGLPGLLVALLMLTTVKEPPRHGVAGSLRLSPLEVGRYLRERWRVFTPMFLGLTLGALSLGAQQWIPTFFQRTYAWDAVRTGRSLGLVQLIAMPLGLALGVWLVERFERRGRADAPLRVVLVAGLVRIPASILMPLMPGPWLAVLCQGLVSCSVGMGGASQNAALQIVTPNQMRGQVTALYLFLFSVIGMGLGPYLTAVLTDQVFHAESELRYALVTLYAISAPLALLFVWLSVRPYVREVARMGARPPPDRLPPPPEAE